MNLLQLHKKAKDAGINIDIRVSGSDYPGPVITVVGHTVAYNPFGSEHYARSFLDDELKYLEHGMDAIDLAVDEIINNLRPAAKPIIKPEMNWEMANAILEDLIETYDGRSLYIGRFKILKYRLDTGERTRELYDEIMALR